MAIWVRMDVFKWSKNTKILRTFNSLEFFFYLWKSTKREIDRKVQVIYFTYFFFQVRVVKEKKGQSLDSNHWLLKIYWLLKKIKFPMVERTLNNMPRVLKLVLDLLINSVTLDWQWPNTKCLHLWHNKIYLFYLHRNLL